jgi:hypothetical protein
MELLVSIIDGFAIACVLAPIMIIGLGVLNSAFDAVESLHQAFLATAWGHRWTAFTRIPDWLARIDGTGNQRPNTSGQLSQDRLPNWV